MHLTSHLSTVWTRPASLYVSAVMGPSSVLQIWYRVVSCKCILGSYIDLHQMSMHPCRAKYCLAITNEILRHAPPNSIIGYDIGCERGKTLKTSSLGPLAAEKGTSFCVGSFHGQGHDLLCQHRNHPRFLDGVGREDFEGCEPLFSYTNRGASLVRRATAAHRRADIEELFIAWDLEKRVRLGVLSGHLFDGV